MEVAILEPSSRPEEGEDSSSDCHRCQIQNAVCVEVSYRQRVDSAICGEVWGIDSGRDWRDGACDEVGTILSDHCYVVGRPAAELPHGNSNRPCCHGQAERGGRGGWI